MDIGIQGISSFVTNSESAMANDASSSKVSQVPATFRLSDESPQSRSANQANVRNSQFCWLATCLVVSSISLIVQLSPDAAWIWRERSGPGYQTHQYVDLRLSDGEQIEVQYLLYLPSGYSSRQTWPMLLFLHGGGQRGNDLDMVERSGPPALLADGTIHPPLLIVSPQCRVDCIWENELLLALLDHLQSRFSIDPNRIYLGGHSMGAYGTWELAEASPERFAAIVPVSGGDDPFNASTLSKLPIWAFHGAKDAVVPVEETQQMVEAIRAAGGKPRMTIYSGRGHDTCNITFSRDDLYDWLLHQRRHQ